MTSSMGSPRNGPFNHRQLVSSALEGLETKPRPGMWEKDNLRTKALVLNLRKTFKHMLNYKLIIRVNVSLLQIFLRLEPEK